jgi:hypothetical protein
MHRAQQAADFIVSHCPNIGAFSGTGEPYGFLQETAAFMRSAKPSIVFPARHIEHIAYAVGLVGSHGFLSPPAAVASVYLATRLEFFFRVLSGSLSSDGTWLSRAAQQAAAAAISDPRLNRSRVASVSLVYQIMKLSTSRVAQYCVALDRILYAAPTMAGGKFEVAHLGDRIEYSRNRVAHGSWGDISAEAVFLGLMTAIAFYAQPEDPGAT